MARSEELQIVVKAIDEASATLKAIHGDLEKMGVHAQQTSTHIDALGNKLTSLGQRVKEGLGIAVGQAIFGELERGFSDLMGLFPKIIATGSTYLDQLHQIQLITGMTAEQTSLFASATKDLGIPTDALDTLFSRLGKNLATNEAKFRDLGVATRDSNGAMLGAAQVIDNLRQQVVKHGDALLTTGAAVELFGKSAATLLPYLHLTNQELADLNTNTARWGGVVSQQAIEGAHQFSVAMNSLGQGITDIATNIFSALSPYLTAFVDAFSKFVQSHLQQIINFAVQVASVVMGVLGGLFGFSVDFSKATDSAAAGMNKVTGAAPPWVSAADMAKKATAAFTDGIKDQIAAIDAHLKAITESARQRKAIEQEEALRKSLANARSQLADLQGNNPFLGGLSAAEQVLAMQKHAQDIANAKKTVDAAQESLGNFQLDQKDQAERQLLERQKSRLNDLLTAHKEANAGIGAGANNLGGLIDKRFSDTFKNIGVNVAAFQKTAADAFRGGSEAAKGFLDILLGTQQFTQYGSTSFRTGGLVGALQAFGQAAMETAKQIGIAIARIQGFFANPSVDTSPGWGFLDPGNPRNIWNGDPLGVGKGGHAAGGWVGLNGPEISLLGERGPEYVVPNTGALGPEFTIHNTSTAVERINTANTMIFSTLIAPAATVIGATGTSLDLSSLQSIAGNAGSLADKLDLLLLHGTMSAQMKSAIVAAVNVIPATDTLNRARTAAYLVVTSSQFQVQR